MIVLSPIIAIISEEVFKHYLTQEEYQSITLIGFSIHQPLLLFEMIDTNDYCRALGISIGVLSGICLFFYFLRIPSQPKKDLSDPGDTSSFK